MKRFANFLFFLFTFVISVTAQTDTNYVTQWGFLGYPNRNVIGNWKFLPSNVPGSAGIGNESTSTVEWAVIRGGFDSAITATTTKGIIVTGNIEFVGAGFESWSGLRYGLWYHDSAGTLITNSADSTRWSGREDNARGYLFAPISGTHKATDGGWGIGTHGVNTGGNWLSTNGANTRVYGTSTQKPARAVATAGNYEFGLSVQPLANGTKEVRFYLIKGTFANSENSTYYFGGSFIDTTTMAPTFNGIVFGVHTTGSGLNPNLRAVKVSDVKVNFGNISLPTPCWCEYYLDQWGVIGNRFGGWKFVPAEAIGNAEISGENPNSNLSAIRGALYDYFEPSSTKAVVFTGKVEFVNGGFHSSNSFRFGIFNSDSAGSLIESVADSTRWSGKESAHSGYLFVPPSGENPSAEWNNGNQGTGGVILNNVWHNPTGENGSALGNKRQLPANAQASAGVYNFLIAVIKRHNDTNEVRYSLTKADNSYNFFGQIIDTKNSVTLNKFNSVAFALDAGNTTTGLKLHDVRVDLANASSFPPTNVEQKEMKVPDQFLLSQNYPNPFNPSTVISYQLPVNGFVTLKIYDMLGREVAILVNEEKQTGKYEVKFNGNNLASGIYFYQIRANDFISTKKLMLLK